MAVPAPFAAWAPYLYEAFSTAPMVPLTYFSVFWYITVLMAEIRQFRPDIVDAANRISFSQPLYDTQTQFDFIVIGAGSAGSVVASRLSENPNWKVLLIEAGLGEPVEAEIPFIAPTIPKIPHIDWQFVTEPSPECGFSQDHRIKWARGKVLGGCSVLNTLAYVRGSRQDFDRWRDMGNPGWGYEDVLHLFKKSEDIRVPALRNSSFHGRGGYLSIEHLRWQSPITQVAIEAAKQLGMYNEDVNGFTQVGLTRTQCNLRNGLRCSAAKAFLRPAKHRPNLHISLGSYVTRILVNPVTKIAQGVDFVKNDTGVTIFKRVFARKEVVLCAGSVKSPQLLMLSGIGSKEQLTKNGIPTIVDLPGVGENLQDHVAVGGVTYVINNHTNIGPVGVSAHWSNVLTNQARTLFTRYRTGPLYSLPRSEANLFTNSKYNDHLDWPDIQVVIMPIGTNSDGGLFDHIGNNIDEAVFKKVYGPYLNKLTIAVSPVFSRPFSRGSIKLRNGNPFSYPKIYGPYYTDSRDMKYMVEACNAAHQFMQAPAFRDFNLTLIPNRFPGCENLRPLSYEYWECQARHWTSSFWHASGSCKMGPRADPMAVVNSRLKVHGVRNLRVADASIMPYITSGNINAPTMMIGEKVANLIKIDWGYLINL